MKQKIVKIVFIIAILLCVILSTQTDASASSAGYTITSYNINMIVNENNTFDITETITVYFTGSNKHGIYRKIPLKNTVTRSDGTSSSNRATVSNIKVSETYTTSTESGYKVIKIGDANKTVTGSHTYVISYTYDIGKDPLKDADELYFNLIGDEWDTSIEKVNFTITMPKEFDSSTLGFSSGTVGSTNSSNVTYKVSGNTITGSLNTTLYSGQALTVRLTLPEGYFVGASANLDYYSIAVIVLCIVCIVIAFILWKKYGKDDKVVETVEFYPPEGMNSAEVGYLYEGKADDKSVISLLIYLANKGYLKIEKTGVDGFSFNKEDFKITKLKEYDGDNECERLFFEGLFENCEGGRADIELAKNIMLESEKLGEKISFKEALSMSKRDTESAQTVTKADLQNNFYLTVGKIKRKLNSMANKKRIFGDTLLKSLCIVLMIIAIYILITVKPIIECGYCDSDELVTVIVFPAIGFMIIIGTINKPSIAAKFFNCILGILIGGIFWAVGVLPALIQNPTYIIMYIIGIIAIVALLFFIKIMPKRTEYGNEMLGKIKGFKRFLETAEKPQLELQVDQNPEYFYNILPYTYALGVSDTWIKQFGAINIQAPDWYDCEGTFGMYKFSSFMNDTMYLVETTMTSRPSSDSGGFSGGGGSSGGGSSGGGSGGGGGGSW